MNLSIVIADFINTDGKFKTYRFIPKNPYNKIVVDRLSDIHTDIKDNTDTDIGLLRIYNSNICELISTTCKIKDFSNDNQKISFTFEHMYIPVESSDLGGCGIYYFILPIGYKLTDLHIVDPFDNKKKDIEEKKHFKYSVYFDESINVQIVQMELRSTRGSFSFILKGEAVPLDSKEPLISYENKQICIDDTLREDLFDEGIKKSFWQNFKDSLLLEPNFNGLGIDLKKLFKKSNNLTLFSNYFFHKHYLLYGL